MKPLTGYAEIRTRGKSGRNMVINSSIIMIAKAKETYIKIKIKIHVAGFRRRR